MCYLPRRETCPNRSQYRPRGEASTCLLLGGLALSLRGLDRAAPVGERALRAI